MAVFSKDDYKTKIWPLIRFANESLPVYVLDGILPKEMYSDDNFLSYIFDVCLRLEGAVGISESDFSFDRYTVAYKDSKPYYILAVSFPFEHNILCVQMVKRMFIVVSENLQRVHCFTEVLSKRRTENSDELYYDLRYVGKENDYLVSFSACEERVFPNAEELAHECAFWAKTMETHGIVGDKGILHFANHK